MYVFIIIFWEVIFQVVKSLYKFQKIKDNNRSEVLWVILYKVIVNGIVFIGREVFNSLGLDLGFKGVVGGEEVFQMGVQFGLGYGGGYICNVFSVREVWSQVNQVCI